MIIKKIFSKITTVVVFRIGVDVLGFPISVKHTLHSVVKERNVLTRYSYK